MSLACGILQLIEDEAARQSFKRVTRLHLEVGALSGVEVESLRFALETQMRGALFDGARIDIDTPAATAWCLTCARSIDVRSRVDACPHCGGHHVQPTGGAELKLREFFVQD